MVNSNASWVNNLPVKVCSRNQTRNLSTGYLSVNSPVELGLLSSGKIKSGELTVCVVCTYLEVPCWRALISSTLHRLFKHKQSIKSTSCIQFQQPLAEDREVKSRQSVTVCLGDSVAQWLASRLATREVVSLMLPCAPVAQ